MEGESETQPPPPPACVSKVLDDDNLLTEILVRVGFPTSLVRAAAVCRRWLGLASDRAFLRRFRELHPPRLLGFYLAHRDRRDAPAHFFPVLPQPPELAAVVRRASFRLDPYDYEGQARTDVVGCSNGTVLTSTNLRLHNIFEPHELVFQVHNPLCSNSKRGGMATIPALRTPFPKSNLCNYNQLFSKKEGGGAVCYFYVTVVDCSREGKSVVQVYMLRNGDDAWRTHLTLTLDTFIYALSRSNSVLVDNKIYIPSSWSEIFVLDLTAPSYSTIRMPQGVRLNYSTAGSIMLSRADDASGIYLIHAKELQLHIWLHKGGNWSLVDIICLRETCADLLEDEPTAILQINHVGDYNAEFLFLEMGRCALYLDVKCRTLHKVHEVTKKDRFSGRIYPFTMIWPPIFPALKDGPDRCACRPFDIMHVSDL